MTQTWGLKISYSSTLCLTAFLKNNNKTKKRRDFIHNNNMKQSSQFKQLYIKDKYYLMLKKCSVWIMKTIANITKRMSYIIPECHV